MHRILPKSEAVNRQKLLVTLDLTKDDMLEHHRICSQDDTFAVDGAYSSTSVTAPAEET